MRVPAPVLIFFLVALCPVADAGAQTTAPSTAQAPAAAASPRPWKFEFLGSHGELSGDHDDEGEYTFELERTVNRRAKWNVAVDQHNRFDELDTQLIVGGQYGFPERRSLIEAKYTEGFGAAQAAQHGIDSKFSFQAHPKVRPELEIEYDRYIDNNFLTTITPGVVLMHKKLNAEFTFVVSNASEEKGGTAGTAGFEYAADERWTITLGGGYGHEHFLARSVTEVRSELTAMQLTGGIQRSLPKHNSLKVEWEYQDRRGAYSKNKLNVTYSKTF